MADMKLRKEIVGVTLDLSRAEVYGLVNTAERIGELLDEALAEGNTEKKYTALREVFGDPQARRELECFYDVSRAAGAMISAEFRQ